MTYPELNGASNNFISSVLGGLIVAYYLGEAKILEVIAGIFFVVIVTLSVQTAFKKLFFN